jgi:acyl-coenzyme A thioesterase PaaI-like protein
MARHAAKPAMAPLAMDTSGVEIPAGFELSRIVDPFEVFTAPLFCKGSAVPGADGDQWLAFRVEEKHLHQGICHRGMVAAFSDAVTSCKVWTANGC